MLALIAGAMVPAAAVAGPWSQAQVRIELQPNFLAHAGEVRLGDVAIVRSTDLRAIRQLVAMPLGSSPQPGTEAWVRRDAISRWLRVRLGILQDDVQWSGADEVQVIGAATESPGRGPVATRGAVYISHGEWVSLEIRSGAVQLEMRAQALQDGIAGQTIKVRTTQGGSVVFARVIGPGRAEAML
ncbi:flagella basal body P-ring formation protein FlgA [Ramlibacter tataouinensis]|uniref:flagella basal body P-ring formation protein FlgA n=1 Tax=Ramlibacter tataouinensis TaxID=94132 RepID=UPI0013145F87|nr:flagella basal body P-ring formation protein FlgA [Ramlibacter tataouinensis]